MMMLGLVVQKGSIALQWIPLSRAYDTENPFVSPLVDVSTAVEHKMKRT